MHPSSWLSISYRADPLSSSLTGEEDSRQGILRDSRIVIVKCKGKQLLSHLTRDHQAYQQAILEGGRVAQVAVTDFLVRSLTTTHLDNNNTSNDLNDSSQYSFSLERLDLRNALQQRHPSRGGRRGRTTGEAALPPYLLERTDIGWTPSDDQFSWYLRLNLWQPHQPKENGRSNASHLTLRDLDESHVTNGIVQGMQDFLSNTSISALLTHVAVAVCQDRLRQALIEAGGVAFVAKGSILPRKSGVSQAPMASPPAIPFEAPPNSPNLNRTLTVDLGKLRPFIDLTGTKGTDNQEDNGTKVTLEGLFVPSGVTLICGGGYHGKSTLLRCIAAGVYNKIPGDGREYSVTRVDALSVRAEDGRYVQNCNISAFISNLPSLPGMQNSVDTQHFSTKEASGSTSQAANVIEALELGCKTMLVDEDVSAANFMARDGRMRALVMDESITPLLYRVNGLYSTHGVSSIVVVGGVGDWLDVPHQVLLMDKYRCTDATAKAKSVSKQFSHGHVQYAGRGVVHRLPWDSSGTPLPRRPTINFCEGHDFSNRLVSLLDGGHGLALYRVSKDDESDSSMEIDEEEDPWIDMSRCEQLLGRKPQLYGCGLAVLGLLRLSRQHPEKGLAALLQEWDKTIDEKGLFAQVQNHDATWESTVTTLGTALRPRALEVGQALCRLRGIQFEEIPIEDDGAEAAARAEEERKKKELMEMWNNRRKK